MVPRLHLDTNEHYHLHGVMHTPIVLAMPKYVGETLYYAQPYMYMYDNNIMLSQLQEETSGSPKRH